MKFSYTWLQEYFDTPLPSVADVSRTITMHAFEIDGTEAHGDDTILDIKVLPNRSHDCFSYHGIAREIGALLDISTNIPDVHPKTDGGVSTVDKLSLTVENSKLVPRALKRYVEGVTIGESPDWLKAKLAAHGQRSINNVVDATNLTMWEIGQPVHAFDFDKLADDKKLTVRPARDGEMITTLDGKEFTLDSDVLVISDSEKALDIAGVKGGSVSGVDANTTRLVLSACNFDPINIRKTSKKLGLRTDASIRFEQGISPELAGIAMERLSALVEELAGGKVARDVVESYPNKKNLYVVGVSLSEINTALGTTCSEEEVESYFKRLGFEYKYTQPLENVLALAPTFVGIPYKLGASVLGDAPKLFDCSSFTAYLFGMSGVMIPRMSVDQYVFGTPIDASDIKAGDLVFANSGKEPIHRESKEFMKGTPVPEGVDHVGLYLGDGMVIHSSASNEKGVEIQTLAESPAFQNIVGYRRIITSDDKRFVVTVPAPRIDVRIKEDLIEEIGRLKGLEVIPSTQLSDDGFVHAVNKTEYYKSVVRRALVDAGFSEVSTYAFQKKGEIEVANPIADDKKYLRGSLTDGVTAAIEMNKKNKPLLGTDMIRIFEIGTVFAKNSEEQEIAIAAEKPAELDRGCAAVAQALGVDITWKKNGALATASLTDAIENLSTPDSYGDLPRLPNMTFVPISIYPFILRDIAVWVGGEGDKDTRIQGYKDLEDVIMSHAGKLLARLDLFDTFTKEGRTSYAYHIVFQSNEKTLSDVEVSEIMKNIEDEIRGKGWEAR
ncbi:MAG: Phenylalanine--tRNA ligase beta subunit [Patescibacteria group bacterium]|nr:Phenylalanine--tRNA ligase beta subunit [Patescibacteria group bacterium]